MGQLFLSPAKTVLREILAVSPALIVCLISLYKHHYSSCMYSVLLHLFNHLICAAAY